MLILFSFLVKSQFYWDYSFESGSDTTLSADDETLLLCLDPPLAG